MSKLKAGQDILSSLLAKLSPVRPQPVALVPKSLAQADTLRGGLQSLEQALAQLKGRPGVKVSDLAMWQHLNPAQKVRPEDVRALARGPKHYAQRGSARGGGDVTDAATDLIWGPELEPQRVSTFRGALMDLLETPALDHRAAEQARRLLSQEAGTAGWEDRARDFVERYHPDGEEFTYLVAHEDWMPRAIELAEEQGAARPFKPAYGEYQRQSLAKQLEGAGGEYFETVLRREPSYERGLKQRLTPGEWASYHFSNPSQLGHVRGTVSPSGQRMLIEEIQSDPIEQLGEKFPGMENVYGKLGGMIMDRAAAADIPLVQIPSAGKIAAVRGGDRSGFMSKLYDRELDKTLYSPLQEMGVPVYNDNGWMTMELSPQMRKKILEGGLLQYKRGGLVK